MGATQSISQPYTLETKKGSVTGIQQTCSKTHKPVLNRYTRIPYALPPVGPLRWRRPQPIQPGTAPFSHSSDVLDHTSFGPECAQPVYNMNAARVENPNAAPEIPLEQAEDCLYLNVWTPPVEETPPEGGWPVQFHIHGGWLQIGNANQDHDTDPFDLLRDPELKENRRIIVAPTYRLNIFGFAAGRDVTSSLADDNGGETTANFGLWDQRAALEWTYQNITLFGGNPDLITVGGLSAGSHSAFLQLYYDSYLSDDQRIIRQAYLWSNAIAIQPNGATCDMLTNQFDELCRIVEVDADKTTSAKDKIEKMRKVKWEDLIAAIPKLKMHTFRTCTDGPIVSTKSQEERRGGFVPPDFLATLRDGRFATKLHDHGVRIMLGEVSDEALLYKMINPPSSYDALARQVGNYYPKPVVDALLNLQDMYGVPAADDKQGQDNTTKGQWADIFARMVADGQVHASLRGLTKCLLAPPEKEGVKAVPKDNLFRYKICWRARGLDDWLRPQVKVCHAADEPIWWGSGWRAGYDEEDKTKAAAILKPFGKFLRGERNIGWGARANEIDEIRLLGQDGKLKENAKDENWERGLKVWQAVVDAQKAE